MPTGAIGAVDLPIGLGVGTRTHCAKAGLEGLREEGSGSRADANRRSHRHRSSEVRVFMKKEVRVIGRGGVIFPVRSHRRNFLESVGIRLRCRSPNDLRL